jgi:hypothetical protein
VVSSALQRIPHNLYSRCARKVAEDITVGSETVKRLVRCDVTDITVGSETVKRLVRCDVTDITVGSETVKRLVRCDVTCPSQEQNIKPMKQQFLFDSQFQLIFHEQGGTYQTIHSKLSA